MRGKRVEYQKIVRTKLEEERYRNRFGLSDNIELQAEADFVLQREFRIDFVFRKVDKILPLMGIFSYFKTHNLLEFKSVNDAFGLTQLRKYLGELFWWLFLKDGGEIGDDEVTLTIMTVRRPNKVLKYLQQPHLPINLRNPSPGHYHWLVLGIEVHLLVINELSLLPEHYAWLSFAEGKHFEAYTEQLSEDITHDEELQIYLDILTELEEEGKARMAYDVITRIIGEMPPERTEQLFLNMPDETFRRVLMILPAELEEESKARMAYDVITRIIGEMPPERQKQLFLNMPDETLQQVLTILPAETLLEQVGKEGIDVITRIIGEMPPERAENLLLNLPAERLQQMLARLPKEQLQKALTSSSDGTTSD